MELPIRAQWQELVVRRDVPQPLQAVKSSRVDRVAVPEAETNTRYAESRRLSQEEVVPRH